MSVPVHFFLEDVSYIVSELITGKSIPVLVGITRLPMDQFLAGLVLSMGAAAGTFFSYYSYHSVVGMHCLGFVNRLVQLSYSLVLSLSMLLSVARGIHYVRGVILSIIPVYCLVVHSLPQQRRTALVSFCLSVLAFVYCMTTPVPASEEPVGSDLPGGPKVLAGIVTERPEDLLSGVWDVVIRSLELFFLAFYACVQHAPTQAYFGHRDRRAVCTSHHHAKNERYSLFVGLVSDFIRVCVWYEVCQFQNNSMHVILENDLGRGGWDWACCVLYTVALLYSAVWTATQIREQVFPGLEFTSETGKLKLVAVALACAALYRQREPQIMFICTICLSLLTVATTGLTLK
jgi:hypothetical protein